MKTKTSTQEILAFIDAARRLPNDDKKELWVKFLVRQYELSCEATVIKGKQNASIDSNTDSK
jgi:hypothetical protein